MVGYTQSSFGDQFNAITPVFVDVDSDSGMNICAIQGNFIAGDNIQIFDKDGNVETTLTYKTRKGNTGWHTAANEYITNYQLPKGKSAWFYTSEAMSITQSGAVYKDAFTLVLGDQFNQTGNPLPREIALSELVFTGLTAGDNIQMFDKDGNVVTTYTYKTRKGVTAWYDSTNTVCDDAKLPAGQAFWVYCQTAGVKMTVPVAIPSAE